MMGVNVLFAGRRLSEASERLCIHQRELKGRRRRIGLHLMSHEIHDAAASGEGRM